MVPAALPLLTSRDRHDARRLVESHRLSFEEDCDDVVGIYDCGRLVATAARAGYVLKMFAIDEDWQGGETMGQLVTALLALARQAGEESLFVYTTPQHAASFEACNFRLLVACGEVALLEYGDGLERYLDRARATACAPRSTHDARRSTHSASGAVVVNGNPFTLGHLSLVEHAAARAERLYLFIVREDRSVFPFDVRFRLARAAVAHLPEVVLLDTSRYAVSAGTFPSYFLRRHDEAARLQMEVDARLFGARIAPALGIGRRFVGDEPCCETTRAYNEALARVLPECGVALEIVPRTVDQTGVISASRVRAALAAGDWTTVERLVPGSSLAFLRSREGSEITRRL